MIDISQTCAPKSDQLNADDLIGGPRTITVTSVVRKDGDQPIAIHFEGDGGKPYKPGKSMRRVLLRIWGQDGAAYAGRRMTLYRDDAVQFGGAAVGGIRISHMSGISSAVTMALTVTRASRKPFTVKPLAEERRPAPEQQRLAPPSDGGGPEGWRQPSGRDRLYADARAEAAKGSDALRAFRADLDPRADRALDGIADELQRIAAGADVAADDDFPGFAPAAEEAA
ncbi:hypothetical protein [Methylobacterium sp. 285MFTsu5.1]|uniref:hypothetical protein n=1 Tax=Methylobacterium sp. 285MFTsu5.1 TaxID=1172187 RepID=UPI00036CD41D|nr:hypothetical protein [Methylobacterium sp. 285MFTsu5.1]